MEPESPKPIRWEVPARTTLGFLCAFALMLFVGGASILTLTKYFDARRAEAHARRFLIQLGRIQQHLVDAETGQRGFLLTGKEGYLEPFLAANQSLDSDIKGLRELGERLPDRMEQLRVLERWSHEKMREMEATIAQRRANGLSTALMIVNTDRGKKQMDQIRALIDTMWDQETALLAERTAISTRIAILTTLLIIVATFLSMVIVGTAIYFINRDIDRREKLEKKLAESNEELEAFAYSVSHDLKAPLRAIHGYAQAIFEDCADKLDADGKRFLDVIRLNAKRMGQLIEDLLTFSRLGRTELRIVKVDTKELFERTTEELAQAYPDAVSVVKLPPELPAVSADKTMLKQVVVNLLSNAIKFSATTPHPAVEVTATEEADKVRLVVKDNGVGFDMKYTDTLFGVFQRLHRKEDFEGTGVGLAIVKRVIERHGGDVAADARPGEGATFSFWLPKRRTA